MVIPESCPACGSTRYKKNGHPRHGKQNHLCKNCERRFSAGADTLLISSERRAEIANLLRERLSLRGICRAVGVSLTWLLHFMVACFASCPAHLQDRKSTSLNSTHTEISPSSPTRRSPDLERLSLRGICRAVGVSLTWLLHFMVACFASCPAHL